MRRFAADLVVLGALLGGCAGMPPSLTNAVVAFGQELVGKASTNYAPEYAQSVNQLLLTVAEIATGAPFAQRPAYAINNPYATPQNTDPYGAQQGGYYGDQSGGYYDSQPPGGYHDDQSAGYGGTPGGYPEPTYDAAGNPVYADDSSGYPTADSGYPTTDGPAGYPQAGYPQPGYSDAQGYPVDQSAYGSNSGGSATTQQVYPDGTGAYPPAPAYPAYPTATSPQNTTGTYAPPSGYPPGVANQPLNSGQTQPYAGQPRPYEGYGTGATAPGQSLTLDVALLAQTVNAAGQVDLRPVQDGETLFDGGGNPAAGDKIKLSFQTNCNCYLYIIGIDATGWVTQIHPEALQASAPLMANQSYLIPNGTEWWGLDAYKGVEQFYFVLSHTPRTDLEQALRSMPTDRPPPASNFQAVSQPALLATRGLVKVQAAAPAQVPTAYGQTQNMVAESFTSQLQTGDLVITRWFQHQ